MNSSTSGHHVCFFLFRAISKSEAKQVGSWYVFDLYQSCACAPCDEEKAEAAEASAVMPATEALRYGQVRW